MNNCIFCHIANGYTNTKLLYEDAEIVVFNDLHPQAPVHVLVVSKKHIDSLDHASSGDSALLGKMLLVVQRLARENGISENGYRTIINCKRGGGQTIFHLHMHLIGGRLFSEKIGRM